MTFLEALPSVNAAFNLTSALLLLAGYVAIRRGQRSLHWKLMAAAFVSSSLFLAGYLTRMAMVRKVHSFVGPLRPLYLTILLTHTVLAVVCLPLILRTFWLSAVRREFGRHVRIARWTLPVWAYVSVTGVVVYVMLYRL